MITLLSIFRNPTTFKAAVAMVPVTNLFQRLAWKGVERQRQAIDPQNRFGGLAVRAAARSTRTARRSFSVDKLQIPLLRRGREQRRGREHRGGHAARRRAAGAQAGAGRRQGVPEIRPAGTCSTGASSRRPGSPRTRASSAIRGTRLDVSRQRTCRRLTIKGRFSSSPRRLAGPLPTEWASSAVGSAHEWHS